MAATATLHNLATFQLSGLLELGKSIRCPGADRGTLEQAAGHVARYPYHPLAEVDDGDRCCAPVRCFTTHPSGSLAAELQSAARSALGDGGDDE